jgi:esterase
MSLNLYLREQGESGPAILLLHGLFGSSANWGSVARDLSRHYRVLIPDLRNHGQSPHHPDVSYAAMTADLLALLDARRIQKAIVIGHSMGGKVGMHLALHHPQRVSGLAVVDMAPVAYKHNFEQVFRAFDAVDLDTLQKRGDADAPMAEHLVQRGVRAFLQQNLQRVDGKWDWRCNLPALRAAQAQITGFDVPEGAKYKGPCSFIHGTLSDYLQPAYESAIYRYFPAAWICPVKGAGHWVYAEQPQGFADCLQRFLITVR